MAAADLWLISSDLCRCCHAEGKFKQLSKINSYLGEKEIYLHLLQDCFNINLEPVVGDLHELTHTICDACIIRLRDAHQFKRQVQTCEEKFNSMLAAQKLALEVSTELEINVKTELPEELLEDADFTDDNFEEDFDWKGDEDSKPPVKMETRSKKKKTKDTNKKPKSSKKETEEVKVETAEVKETQDAPKDEEQKKGTEQRFQLTDQDYRKDGDNFICLHCDTKYDKITSLRYHIRVKHHKVPRFICICKRGFMTPAQFTIHKLEEHGIDDRFSCNACKGVFNTKVQLRKHKNIFHMLGEKLKCDFCDYETFSLEGMYKHKFKHKTVKDYHCRFCRKSFLRKATLELHERIHTGDRRKVCSVCGQAFVQKASLNYHMTKYHPEVNF